MSDQVQRQQEYQATLQSCVDSKGWNVTITRDGGVEEPFSNDEYERYALDRDACRLEAGLSDGQDVKYDEDQLATIYDRDLDTVACLRAEGYNIARPQSKEAYIEASLKAQNGSKVAGWWPYGDQALEKISEAEYQRLQEICPEPWWSE